MLESHCDLLEYHKILLCLILPSKTGKLPFVENRTEVCGKTDERLQILEVQICNVITNMCIHKLKPALKLRGYTISCC